jgi:hypothetical protein
LVGRLRLPYKKCLVITKTTPKIKKRLKALENEVARLRRKVSGGDSEEELDGDEKWEKLFADPRSEELLSKMAAEAKKDFENGNTIPSEEFFCR